MASEKVKALGHHSLSDTFWTFARVVSLLKIDKLADADVHNLRYSNAAYNAAIHKAAGACAEVLTGPNGPVEQAAQRLDLAFGRDVLSTQYSKLIRLVAEAKKHVSAGRAASDVVAWMLDYFTLSLRMKWVTPAKATEQFLERERKTGQAGFWASSAVVMQASCLEVFVCNMLPALALSLLENLLG